MRSSKVLIAAPVRDRDAFLPKYLECLEGLRHPSKDIGFYFLLNDSSDGSEEVLKDFRQRNLDKYAQIEIATLNLGTPRDARKASIRPKVYHSLAKLRNTILEKFETSDYDYLFSVDTDIYVEPKCLARLMWHQKDFVAAMISNMKGRMCPNAMVEIAGSMRRWFPPESATEPGIYEVGLSGAVCLMSRKVIGSRYAWSDNGEDLPFCKSLQERGIKIYIDTAPLAEHDMG